MNAGNARLALLCVAQFVVVLDLTIVAIALPTIGADLGFSPEGLQWVVSAYTLVFGGGLMLAGRAADLYGRRRAFAAGLAVFAGASLACALAESPAALVAARVVQGAGAALVAPSALALLVATVPEGPRRTRALGVWTAAAAGGGASGWVLGGVISEHFGWPWVFGVSVPVGVLGLLLVPRLLPESRDATAPRRLDVPGAIALTGGVGALLIGLTELPLALVAGAGALAAFVAIERRASAPLVPLDALRAPGLTRAGLVALALTATTTPAMFLCVLDVQGEGGASPAEAGLVFAPFNLAVIAGSLLGPRLDGRGLMPAGLLGVAVGAAVLPLGWTLAGFAAMGVGLGVASVASTALGAAAAGPDRQGLAASLLNTAAQLGSALGLAVLVGPAVSAGYGWGWAGAAALAAAAALALRRPRAATRRAAGPCAPAPARPR